MSIHSSIGTHFSSFFPATLATTDLPSQILNIAAVEGRHETEGFRTSTRGPNHTFWARDTLEAVKDFDGNVVWFIRIIKDISARKKWDKELQQVVVGAEAARLARTSFLAGVSHDIRYHCALLVFEKAQIH